MTKRRRVILALNVKECDHLARVLTPTVQAISACTPREVLERIDEGDILVLDWHFPNNTSQTILAHWISQKGKPVCVVANPPISNEEVDSIYQCGASHVLTFIPSSGTLLAIISQYIRQLNVEERVDSLARSLRRTQQLLIILISLLTAVAVGNDKIGQLITSLLR